MLNDRKIQSWLPLLMGLILAAGMAGGYQLYRHMAWKHRPFQAGANGSLQQVLDLVNLKYVDSISMDSAEMAGIHAVTRYLDPHSVFIPASEIGEVQADLTGNFSGIGVEYQMIADTLMVVNIIEKGPAAAAGVLPGDAIIAVNDSLIAGKPLSGNQLRAMLRGKRGSIVKVTILRDGKSIAKNITRGDVPLPSVDAAYMIAPQTGYIRLNRFAETTFFEFMDAATALEKAGMKKLILDLRGNGGGLLDEATKIADELLEDGLTIVSTKGAKVKPETVYATKPGLFEKGAIAVLIDEQSASASEVLAASLQEHDRATIVGRRSFGKGLVQEQYDLANGGALRLTVARYFTPLGRSIQKPYQNGQEAYSKEITERRLNGTTAAQPDTAGKKVFVTRKGKKLYESGGITPDTWVPADSNTTPAPLFKLYHNDLMPALVFRVYQSERNTLSGYANPVAFDTGFVFTPTLWKTIVQRAASDSIDLGKLNPADQKALEQRMKLLLARIRWRNNGYFQLANKKDPTVLKALEILMNSKS